MQNSLPDSGAMPLVEAMLKYKEENIYPFHTPGHKGGRGMEPKLRDQLGAGVVMDVSLMSELDDIHEPQTYIAQAQQLAAAAYGSDACFWAVNGTTQAIQAMLMTALKPGEKVLVPRNAHRSVAGGLILGGLQAAFIQPRYLENFKIYSQVTAEDIEQALREDKSIKAVLITSPNYYGIAADTAKIAEVCHKYQLPLLVDEAHGPHLGFSSLLPPSAMESGADACAQSTHKILGAMTQCSMLHVKQGLLDIQQATDVMSVLTTTSPNYLLMASLDAARAQLQQSGRQMSEQAVDAAQKLAEVFKSFEGLKVLSAADTEGFALDSTKVTVNFAQWGYTGIEMGDIFRKEGIAVELVDAENVLFLVTYADANQYFAAILVKLRRILENLAQHKRQQTIALCPPALPKTTMELTLRDVFYGAKTVVPLTKSCGHICAEQVSFYPPGIPILLPGEYITAEIIDYCCKMKALGLPVSGPADSKLESIRVVKR